MAVSKTKTNLPPGGVYLTDGACLSSKFHHVALKDAVAARLAAPDTLVGHHRHSIPGSPGSWRMLKTWRKFRSRTQA